MNEQNEESQSLVEVSQPSSPPSAGEMGFLEHLEELRWRILHAVAALVIGSILCFTFSDYLMDLLIRPYEEAVLSIENQQKIDVIAAVESFVKRIFSDTAPTIQSNKDIVEIPAHRRLLWRQVPLHRPRSLLSSPTARWRSSTRRTSRWRCQS